VTILLPGVGAEPEHGHGGIPGAPSAPLTGVFCLGIPILIHPRQQKNLVFKVSAAGAPSRCSRL